jgi:hypothetical protein
MLQSIGNILNHTAKLLCQKYMAGTFFINTFLAYIWIVFNGNENHIYESLLKSAPANAFKD